MSRDKSLYAAVRQAQNLNDAWRHVRKSAQNSNQTEVRRHTELFEKKHHSKLRKTADQLRAGNYNFSPAKGVLKDKEKREAKGKAPRPIVVASLNDRVVQRAILQVLNPKKDGIQGEKVALLDDPRLGKLNRVNRSKFGIGGLSGDYGGTKPASRIILETIASGASHFYRSDIKAFFTEISTTDVVKKIRQETGDDDFADLIESAFEVILSNEDDLRGYLDLFPRNGKGAAQGGALSALAGNILLYEFDQELNKLGVTAIRYVDDLLILSSNKEKLDHAVAWAEQKLREKGFSLYLPVDGNGKAATGRCADKFEFIGRTFGPNYCSPTVEKQTAFVKKIDLKISVAKREILEFCKNDDVLSLQRTYAATLHDISVTTNGWLKAYPDRNDHVRMEAVMHKLDRLVNDFSHFVFRRSKSISSRKKGMLYGLPHSMAGVDEDANGSLIDLDV